MVKCSFELSMWHFDYISCTCWWFRSRLVFTNFVTTRTGYSIINQISFYNGFDETTLSRTKIIKRFSSFFRRLRILRDVRLWKVKVVVRIQSNMFSVLQITSRGWRSSITKIDQTGIRWRIQSFHFWRFGFLRRSFRLFRLVFHRRSFV